MRLFYECWLTRAMLGGEGGGGGGAKRPPVRFLAQLKDINILTKEWATKLLSRIFEMLNI